MANQKITVEVEVQANTAKEVKDAERLGAALKDAAASAQKIKVPAGATTGVQSVMAKSQPVGAQAVMEYGQQRGAAGATGAAARDFARQSEGLGGLVRLYATYAANIYAVGAAFSALSNAMNTTNMVKGLDTLGAATGRNLGSLSKRLVEVSDGALSFRDAMESVATTSAAGISAKDTEKLAVVAKNASVALGKNMPDALNRLSRAVTKLEPELLDELGIMTKIDPAVQEYALKLGKATSQLTQAQRQQAFLNAVLKEGTEKFSELNDIAANPFDKLSASLKNTLQGGLELVNNVIGPIVRLLAESPVGLAAAIAAVGIALVKQAMPALGAFRASLAATAAESTALAKSKRDEANEAQSKLNTIIRQDAEAEAERRVKAVDDAEKRIQAIRERGYSQQSVAYRVLQKDVQDVDKSDFARLERSAKRFERRGLLEEAAAYRALSVAIKDSQATQEKYLALSKKLEEQALKRAESPTTVYGMRQDLAKKAEATEFKQQTISNAATNASLIGLSGAWKILNAEIATSNIQLGFFGKAMLQARGALGIFLGAASTVGAALSGLLGWVGLIVTAIGVLDSVFSNNSKQSQAFSSALEKAGEAAAGAGRTLEFLNKKGNYFAQSIEGVYALSNALQEVADSTDGLTVAAEKAKNSLSVWESFKDRVASVFGGGIEKNLNKALSDNISAAFKLLSRAGLEKEAKEAFGKILNIDVFTPEAINEAISKLSGEAKKQAEAALLRQQAALTESSQRLQSFKGAAEATKKAYDEFIQSTASTNPLFKVGDSLKNLSLEMMNLKTDGIDEVEAAFDKVAKNPQFAMLFGESFVNNLVVVREEFLRNKQTLASLDDQIAKTTADIKKYKDEAGKPNAPVGTSASGVAFGARPPGTQPQGRQAQAQANLEYAQDDLRLLNRVRTTTFELNQESVKKAKDLFGKGVESAFAEGSRLIEIAIGQSTEKAALVLAKSRAGALTGVARVKTEGAIAIQELKIQERAITTNIDLILVQEKLSAILEANSAAVAANTAAKDDTLSEDVKSKLQDTAAGLKAAAEAIAGSKDYAALKNVDISQLTPGAQNVFRSRIEPIKSKVAAQEGARKEVKAAIQAKGEENVRAEAAAEAQRQKDNLAGQQAINEQFLNRLGIIEQISGVTTAEGINAQNRLQTENLLKKQTQERKDVELEIRNAQSGVKLGTPNAALALTQSKEKERLLIGRQVEEQANLAQQNRNKLLQFEIDQVNKGLDKRKLEIQQNQELLSLSLELKNTQLSGYSSLYDIVKNYGIEQQYLLDVQKAQLEYTNKMGVAQAELDAKKLIAQKKIKELIPEGDLAPSAENAAAAAGIQRELDLEQEKFNIQDKSAKQQKDSRLQILQINKDISLEQEKFNKMLEQANSFADHLRATFDGLGQGWQRIGGGLSDLVKASAQFTVNSEKNAKALDVISKKLDETDEHGQQVLQGDDRKKALESFNEQLQKNRRDELSANIEIIGSTKKMFKEKTGAYKLLSGIEKAMHVQRMIMNTVEIAANLKKTVTEVGNTAIIVAATMQKAGAKAIEAIAGAGTAPFPIGFIAAGAMMALMAKILGKGFGSASTPSFSPTKEQRQETQGTAMQYVKTDTKVQVRTGVLGAPDQKTESIAKSISILAKNSEFSLEYSDKLLRSFERLSLSIEKAVGAIAGTKGLLRGPVAGIEEGVRSSYAGFKKTTTEVVDSGIKLVGTLQDIAVAGQGVVTGFADVKVTTDRTFRGDTITNELRNINLPEKTIKTIRDSLVRVYQTGLDLGAKGGLDESLVRQRVGAVSTTQLISLRDLSGEDLQRAYESGLSQIYDDIAESLYGPLIESYGKLLEAPGDAATRILDSNEKINVALRQTNPALRLRTLGFDVTEAITDSFGGLDSFLSKLSQWNDTFLTEEEKDANRRDKIGRLLHKYNITELKDKDQYIKIVRTMIDNNETNTEKFREFMEAGQDISKVFTDVTDAVKDSTTKLKDAYDKLAGARDTLKDIVKTMKDFKESLLTGDKSILTPGEKYLQTKGTFERTRDLAISGDVQAIKDLPGASTAFLEASRLMFSSSEQYTQDFNAVSSAVDSIIATNEGYLTEAEAALAAAKESLGQLEEININTKITSEAIQGLIKAVKEAQGIRDQLPKAEPTTAAKLPPSAILAVTSAIAPTLATVPIREAAVTAATAAVEASVPDIVSSIVESTNNVGANIGDAASDAAAAAAAAAESAAAAAAAATAATNSLNTSDVANSTMDAIALAANIAIQNAVAEAMSDPSISSADAEGGTGLGGGGNDSGTFGEGQYASGATYLSRDQRALVHEGERIIPAADNRQLMKMVTSYSTNGGELYQEVCRLTKQVEQLTQVVADGAIMNAQATDRNTEQLATTIQDSAEAATYNQRLQNRTAVV